MPEESESARQEPYIGDSPQTSLPQEGEPRETPRVENGSAPDPAPAGTPGPLQEAERKAAEHREAWLRAKAETENVRKRTQIEVANAHKYALEGFASDLLPVKDSLEATLAADKATLEALRSGVELTLKQLASVFEKAGLKEIDPAGQKFDPHRHQAISMLPSDKEPNTVINVLQKGYLLNDRVIRPALVTVAKGRDA